PGGPRSVHPVPRPRTERARPSPLQRSEHPVGGGAETTCATDHIRWKRGNVVSRGWLASMTLDLLCAGSGWSTMASAQEAEAPNNKLVFAVVVNQIFNQGQLAL